MKKTNFKALIDAAIAFLKGLSVKTWIIVAASAAVVTAGVVVGVSLSGHEHAYGEWSITQEATCTQTGLKTRTCECGEEEQESIPALGHAINTEWTVDVEPTCTTVGSKSHLCTRCENKVDVTEIPANGHSFDEWTQTLAPTCAENGSERRDCSVCEYFETQDVNTLEHEYGEWTQTLAPTCTEKGSERRDCEGCEHFETQDVNALGHTDKDAVIENKVDATCTADGSYDSVIYCSVCNSEVSREAKTITKFGHDYSIEWTTDIIPTCTTVGSKSHHCSRCDDKADVTEIPANGHTNKEAVVENKIDAICTTDGSYDSVIYCSVCNGEVSRETKTIAKLGHDYATEWTIDLAPTCTVKGSKSRHCSRCDSKKDVTQISATGHTDGEWVVGTLPTCTTNGQKNLLCSVCNQVIKTQTWLAYGHTEVIDPAVEATCTNTGLTEGKHCAGCNKVFVAQQFIDYAHEYDSSYMYDESCHWKICKKCQANTQKVDHTLDNNGVCTGCDMPITITPDVFYDISSDGTYAEVVDYSGTATRVKIAKEYRGLPVKHICDNAFSGQSQITYIELPDSITSIGENAFKNCSGLKELVFSNSVTNISKNAFYGCSSLTDVYYMGSISDWFNIKLVDKSSNPITNSANLYLNNQLLTELAIPSNVTSIDAYRFYGCLSLTSIKIPSSVKTIAFEAFYGCNNLKSITIPFVGASLNGTSNTHFGYIFGCSAGNLIDGKQKTYIPTSLKEVVITGGTSIQKNAFWLCTPIEKIVISNGVTNIAEQAFRYCPNLKSITLPNTLTSIGASAFSSCSALTSIEIPNSVKSIGLGAFDGCNGLKSVTIPFVGASLDGTSNTHFGYIFGASNATNNTKPSSLEEIVITGGTFIDTYAFKNCGRINKLTIPASVKSIGKDAFSGTSSCVVIDNLYYTGTVKDWCEIEFGERGTWHEHQCQIKKLYIDNELVKDLLIPNSITKLGRNFYRCESIESVTIPENLTEIVYDTFYGCTSLKKVNITNLSAWCNNTIASCLPISATELYLNGELVTDLIIPNDVTYISSYAFSGFTCITSVTIPNSVTTIGSRAFAECVSLTKVIIPDGVTVIADEAFSGCTNLTSIAIPNSVTSIGSGAFSGCTNLSSVIIPDGLTAINDETFSNCTSLTNITLPNGVTSVGSGAFSGCTSLTSLVIPESITNIAATAFADCPLSYNEYENGLYLGSKTNPYFALVGVVDTRYRSYTIHNNTRIIINAFNGCSRLSNIKIPSGVKSISSSAFSNCTSLTSITIPSGVTSIGNSAFEGCTGLTSITIPSGVTSIGNSAFKGCTGLTSITIPSNVTSIGSSAFAGCTALTSITIPSNVTSIGSSAFAGCTGLTSIKISHGVTDIGGSAFASCTGVTSIVIPGSVKNIGGNAFYNCTSLTSVVIQDGVTTSIGSGAFKNCTKLQSISIPFVGATKDGTENTHFGYIFGAATYSNNGKYVPTSLKTVEIGGGISIDDYAFYDCTSLTKIILPSTLERIESSPFYGCSGLTSLTIPYNVKELGTYFISGCRNLTRVTFERTTGWWITKSSTATSGTSIPSNQLANSSTAYRYLNSYYDYYWHRS